MLALSAALSIAGMAARWEGHDDHLSVELQAPTQGWLLIGFNDTASLDGARLVMVSVAGDHARIEEHIAAPPRHGPHRGSTVASVTGFVQDDQGTTVRLVVPRDSGDARLAPLVAGQRRWVWLAWSHGADFQHHSARRDGAWVTLPSDQVQTGGVRASVP